MQRIPVERKTCRVTKSCDERRREIFEAKENEMFAEVQNINSGLKKE